MIFQVLIPLYQLLPVPAEMTETFGVRSREDLLKFAAGAAGAPA